MRMSDLIVKKRDGQALTTEEIRFVVDGYTRGEIPDYQMSAMLMYPEDVLKKEEFARRFPGLDEESNPVLFIGKLR